MGNILMIIGNLDMTCFGRESGGGDSFQNSRWQYCLLRQHGSNDLTGYNAKLTFFGFKLIMASKYLFEFCVGSLY